MKIRFLVVVLPWEARVVDKVIAVVVDIVIGRGVAKGLAAPAPEDGVAGADTRGDRTRAAVDHRHVSLSIDPAPALSQPKI